MCLASAMSTRTNSTPRWTGCWSASGQLADIEPLHVAAYIEALGKDFEKPTVKQHPAAIRMLFDWLVTGGILATNPAHAVRGPKHTRFGGNHAAG